MSSKQHVQISCFDLINSPNQQQYTFYQIIKQIKVQFSDFTLIDDTNEFSDSQQPILNEFEPTQYKKMDQQEKETKKFNQLVNQFDYLIDEINEQQNQIIQNQISLNTDINSHGVISSQIDQIANTKIYKNNKNHNFYKRNCWSKSKKIPTRSEDQCFNLQNHDKRKKIKKTRTVEKKKLLVKSETKNIVKNFGKQIIRFVNENKPLISRILTNIHSNLTFDVLNSQLQKNRKNKMSKNIHLKQMWTNDYSGKQMRVISQQFLHKHCYHWIFNSRVQDYSSQLKYKHRLQSVINDPHNFFELKYR